MIHGGTHGPWLSYRKNASTAKAERSVGECFPEWTVGISTHVHFYSDTFLHMNADRVHPLIETQFPDALVSSIIHPLVSQKSFWNGLKRTTMSLRCRLGLHIPQTEVQSSISGMCSTIRIHRGTVRALSTAKRQVFITLCHHDCHTAQICYISLKHE